MPMKIDTYPAITVTLINEKRKRDGFMVNIQFGSFSGRRLFYVSPCTSRCHLSQKALLSCMREGNVPARETFLAGDGNRCLERRSSVRWQGYVQGYPLLYIAWWRHWHPYSHDLPVHWKRRWSHSMRHSSTFYFG